MKHSEVPTRVCDRLAISPMKWWWAPAAYVVSVLLSGLVPLLADVIGWTWLGEQSQMIGYAIALPLVIALFGRKLPGSFTHKLGWIGLGGRRLGRTIGIGAAYGVACVIVIEILQRFGGFGSSGSAELFREAQVGQDVGCTLALLSAICLIAPVVEEIFFRAGLFRPVRDAVAGSAWVGSARTWLAALAGLAVSGLAFLEAHGGQPKILFLYLLSAAYFTGDYLTTSSLTGAVVAHGVNNVTVILMLLGQMGDIPAWVFALPPLGLLLSMVISVACGSFLDRPDNDVYAAGGGVGR